MSFKSTTYKKCSSHLFLLMFSLIASLSFAKTNEERRQNDFQFLNKWETELQNSIAGNLPWYRKFQSFVVLEYNTSSFEDSNFLDFVLQTIVRTKSDSFRNYCIFSNCRLEVFRSRASDIFNLVRGFKSQLKSWDYDRIYKCSTFTAYISSTKIEDPAEIYNLVSNSRGFESQSPFIYRAADNVSAKCRSYTNSDTELQCWTNTECDFPGFKKNFFICETRSFDRNYSLLTRDTETGSKMIDTSCAKEAPKDIPRKQECLRNTRCKPAGPDVKLSTFQ